MKNLLLIVALLLNISVFAQVEIADEETMPSGNYESSTKTIVVYTSNFPKGSAQLEQFLKNYKVTISRSNKSESHFEVNFRLPVIYLNALDSLAAALGYTTQNSFNMQNMGSEVSDLKLKIRRLELNNKSLETDLQDTSINGSERNSIRNKIRNNTTTINDYKYRLEELGNKSKGAAYCQVNFTLRDEVITPGNSKVSFVNMPGFEYNYLFIENPKAGLSAKAYQGYGVKYMFTRGKSFFNLGVYKAVNNNKADSTLIGDLFNIQFGQDFYPRHFGRGKRKFLNLYTGYQAGGFIATRNNDASNGFIPVVNLAMGVEIFKSKHILLDNKVSYFLPLNNLNRNMRGINYGLSLNFVF